MLLWALYRGIVIFFCSSQSMKAVGRAAFDLIEEIRRQFREIPGLMEGKAKPEYALCGYQHDRSS